MGTFPFKLILSHVILLFIKISTAIDFITQSQSLTDGNALLSQGKTFELGFFSPATSKNRYLGIWSKNSPVQTVIWVANWNNPIQDSSGNLVINKTGTILLLSQNNTLVWSAGLLNQVQNPILQLLDSGNLVLREESDANPDKYSWQSFDYSTDSLSVSNHYYVPNKSLTVIMALNNQPNSNYCDTHALCGPYGYCNISTSPVCKCLDGFKPRAPDRWNKFDKTDGCEREEPLNCGGGNNSNNSIRFEKYTDLQAPDGNRTWVDRSLSLEECRTKCLNDCSCSAYGNVEHVRGAWSGCALWFGDLINLKALPEGGQDIYVRMLASEIVVTKNSESNRKRTIGAVTGCLIALILAILLFSFFICRKRSNFRGQDKEKEDFELPSFDLSTISKATDNFSTNNKLGQGGFGPVYKGRLTNGQEIAVKRLSKNSGQGMNEFKNEVILFSKLQHRNLVRLLGCCLQGEEKMLIYEYLPNKSLDFFIFDETKGKLLGWSIRFRIICGIARGLLYLHRDSRLRIIHRDLKASNILLDGDMNPKISDFGLARTFGGDQTEASTRRVVGTYGYMAPEYAIDGQFSVKSDVFSFGILLLEIISGKRNRGFYRPNHNDLNLIGYAWTLWNQGRPAELIDEIIDDSWSISEVLRCIHVGLLCAQQHPEDRPTMSSVVMMLGSDNIALPPPKQPGFFVEEAGFDNIEFQSRDQLISANELSVTVLEPR